MKPARDARYLRWIRTLQCSVRGCSRTDIEAAHTGPHGLGQKASDFQAIPLCTKHHRTGANSYHNLGPVEFSRFNNLDIPSIVRALSAKPTIRVIDGRFIGMWGHGEFLLGPVHIGIRAAISRMLSSLRVAA